MARHDQRSAWGNPWLWGGVGCCLGCVALPVLLVTVLGVGIAGIFSSSGVFDAAMERARANPEVVEALGEPIERGWLIHGEVNISTDSGHADLSVPIHGPRGRGKLYLLGDKVNGEWVFERLEVRVEGREEPIDLLGI